VGGAGLGGRCRDWDGDGDDVDGLEQGHWHGAGDTRVGSAMGSMMRGRQVDWGQTDDGNDGGGWVRRGEQRWRQIEETF
jgi:hypothetical protein